MWRCGRVCHVDGSSVSSLQEPLLLRMRSLEANELPSPQNVLLGVLQITAACLLLPPLVISRLVSGSLVCSAAFSSSMDNLRAQREGLQIAFLSALEGIAGCGVGIGQNM